MQKRSLRHVAASHASVRPRIFIGSSVEGLDVARAVQSALYFEAEPILWSQGVFGLSGGTLETLVAEANSFDFAVFILTADDLVQRRGRRGNAPRDNVLFEMGLFMGKLGRERTFYACCKTDKILLPTDLAGVTAAHYLPPSEQRYLQAALSAATTPILSAIRTLGARSGVLGGDGHLSKEVDHLRNQVFEMRIALSSYAAYAQTVVPPKISELTEARTEKKKNDDIEFLKGTWEDELTRSTAWSRLSQGRMRFLYCYQGSGKPTGEFYDWKRQGNTIRGRFRWFEEKEVHGYVWFEIIDEKTMKGGWWWTKDVPSRNVHKLPHIPGMVPMEWMKVDDETPNWIKPYFNRTES